MHSLVCGRITPWRNRAYCCMKSTCEACRFGSKIGGGNYTSMLRVALDKQHPPERSPIRCSAERDDACAAASWGVVEVLRLRISILILHIARLSCVAIQTRTCRAGCPPERMVESCKAGWARPALDELGGGWLGLAVIFNMRFGCFPCVMRCVFVMTAG